jgi:hypothetical protein
MNIFNKPNELQTFILKRILPRASGEISGAIQPLKSCNFFELNDKKGSF